MDILYFGMIIEIAAVVILLLVLILLYRFSSFTYSQEFMLVFFLYLALLIFTLIAPFKNKALLDGLIKFLLIIVISGFLLKPFFLTKKYLKRKFLFYVYIASIIFFPLLLILQGQHVFLESLGYILLGIAFIIVGIYWIKEVLTHLLASKVTGVTFILFGLHLMDFIVFQYSDTTLAYGYLIAASFEVIIALCLIFLNFAHLKEQDTITYGKYRNLFDNASDAILLIKNDVILDCNSKAEELFETTKENIVGLKPMDLSSPIQENGRDAHKYGAELFDSASEGKVTHFDWVHLSAKGNKKVCEISLFKIEANQFASIIRDMTDKYAYEEEINFHKYYDYLTHLPKRELFMDRLTRALEEQHGQVALIAFNLDNFKQINDEYGHEIGDEILIRISKKVQDTLTSEISMTRIGGDQFIIMLNKLHHMNLIYLPIEKIQTLFSKSFKIRNNEINISACIGVAFANYKNIESVELLKNVDLALNLAKSKGRGQLEFYSEQEKEIFTNRVKIEKDMRQGINNKEFVPYFQPIIDLKTGEIIGAEALARWIKSDGTVVYPDLFIPIAEETNLISKIGERILFESAKVCKEILKNSPDFLMHVNFSPLQLKNDSIIRTLNYVMESNKLTAKHLAIEITETVFIDDSRNANHILKQIRSMGIGVALDDFGTGYSSLSYLVEMQVDTIKIDRSFVVKLPKDQKAKAILKYLTGLMHNLGYNIIVEGVEEKEQLDFLKTLGCDCVQGYYYYRPMPYEDLKNLIIENNL